MKLHVDQWGMHPHQLIYYFILFYFWKIICEEIWMNFSTSSYSLKYIYDEYIYIFFLLIVLPPFHIKILPHLVFMVKKFFIGYRVQITNHFKSHSYIL